MVRTEVHAGDGEQDARSEADGDTGSIGEILPELGNENESRDKHEHGAEVGEHLPDDPSGSELLIAGLVGTCLNDHGRVKPLCLEGTNRPGLFQRDQTVTNPLVNAGVEALEGTRSWSVMGRSPRVGDRPIVRSREPSVQTPA